MPELKNKFAIYEKYLELDLVQLRKQNRFIRVDKPTRPRKARTLGYKCKRGLLVIRTSIKKGGMDPVIPARGRKPSNLMKRKSRNIPKMKIAVSRVLKRYPNLNLVNCYKLTQDGKTIWYQVILVDPVVRSKL